MMKRLLKFSRASAAASTASVPSASGFTVSDNSRGASVTAAELSAILDTTLDEINLDDEVDVPLRDLLHQLDLEASRYENSKLKEDVYTQWKCSKDTAHLISIACKCAVGSYHPTGQLVDTPQYIFKSQYVTSPSAAGSVKSSTFTVVEPAQLSSSVDKDHLLRVLVIAIRGSASKVDHMVNANQESKDATGFIDTGLSSSNIKAHAGFLNSARQLEETVIRRIRSYIDSQSQKCAHIMLTGHSAGGAVASLLFLRLLHRLKTESALLSCITFGSPPLLTVPIDLTTQTANNIGLVVNLINECDLVCRADKPYVLSLVRLLSSKFAQKQQPSISRGESVFPNTPENTNSKSQTCLQLSTDSSPSTEAENHAIDLVGGTWSLPAPEYHHVGDKVILLTRLNEDGIALKAVEISNAEFEKLLFCRLTVHRKSCYADRVGLIEQGEFNM